ncbi:hypothetical protein M0R04_06660 [Candidatus Dojkabacteria bacterium]|jgi:hypothetical protein|nr:hypothetical protein [Candidatus Dojkabacteria bacterium]
MTIDMNNLEKYEKFFRFRNKRIKLEKVSFKKGISVEKISNHYHDWMKGFQKNIFQTLMRMEWLDRHLLFDGYEKKINKKNGRYFNFGRKLFWQEMIGFNHSLFNIIFFKSIASYLDDFFPNYEEIDVFDYDFPYPFEYMRLENLYYVHKMPNRMELLLEGERRKMNVGEFEDFVVAWFSDDHYKTGRMWNIYDFNGERNLRFVKQVIPLAEKLKMKGNK